MMGVDPRKRGGCNEWRDILGPNVNSVEEKEFNYFLRVSVALLLSVLSSAEVTPRVSMGELEESKPNMLVS